MTTRPPRDAGGEEQRWFAHWARSFGCPPPDLLGPASEGTLQPPALADAVRGHLDACALCQALLAALADASDPTGAESARIGERIHASVGAGRTRMLYRIAATLVLAVGAASVTWWAVRSRTPRVPPAATPVAQAPASSTPPVYVLPLDKPITELPPESLTLRSATQDSYAAALGAALQPYNRGNYAEATKRLTAVSRDYPGKPHAAFYLGMSQLLGGDPASAVEPLRRAAALAPAGSSLSANAAWYLAVALERSGASARAALVLKPICEGTSGRRQQACSGLHALGSR